MITHYYGLEDQEIISETDRDEAIYQTIEDMPWPLAESFNLIKYKPQELCETIINQASEIILGSILEYFDENYGCPDGDTIRTKAMKDLTEKYVEDIKKLYRVWQLERVSKEEINIKKWIIENEPQWLVTMEFEED